MCGSRSGIIFFCSFLSLFLLCLAPDAFASAPNLPSPGQVLDDPNYSWKLSSSGNVYRVYDPPGARASSSFAPSSSFSEGESGGVIQTFSPRPLTIDGATGDVVADLSRSLTVGDLVDGLGKLMSVDNPLGLTVLAATTVLPFAQVIYDDYYSNPVTSGPTVAGSPDDPQFAHDACEDTDVSPILYGSTPYSVLQQQIALGIAPKSSSFISDSVSGSYERFSYSQDQNSVLCSGTGVVSSTPSTPSSSSNFPKWVANNWVKDNLANDASSALQHNPSFGPNLANQLAKNAVPLVSRVPYFYTPTSNSLSQSPSTTTSTNPSTGSSTTTTSTPSYKVSSGPDGGLKVLKITKFVTQTCTAAGACSVTKSSSQTQPTKSKSPFIPPSSHYPKVPTTVPTTSTPFTAFSFGSPWLPKVCPSAPTYQVCVVGGSYCKTEKLPTNIICKLASGIEPVVTAGGGLLGILILAW